MSSRIVLKDGAKYNYTKVEQRLFAHLSDKRKTTSSVLAEKCFGDDQLYARNNVVARMRTLVEKVKLNKEPFKIINGGARGPRPSEYWIERD